MSSEQEDSLEDLLEQLERTNIIIDQRHEALEVLEKDYQGLLEELKSTDAKIKEALGHVGKIQAGESYKRTIKADLKVLESRILPAKADLNRALDRKKLLEEELKAKEGDHDSR